MFVNMTKITSLDLSQLVVIENIDVFLSIPRFLAQVVVKLLKAFAMIYIHIIIYHGYLLNPLETENK